MAQIRIDDETKLEFDNLKIWMWWVKLKSADDKLNHLLWFFKHYENNNGDKK